MVEVVNELFLCLSPLICQQLSPGDHVQAKWTDGRMYYGKVMKLNDGEQEVFVRCEEGD